MAVSALMVIKTEWFFRIFGRIPWAEAHLGGGTRMFIKLLGIVLIIVSFLVVTNLWEPLLAWFLGPLFGRSSF